MKNNLNIIGGERYACSISKKVGLAGVPLGEKINN